MGRSLRPMPAIAGIILAVCVLAGPAMAQVKPGVLDKDTFMDMESVSNPAISPDGSQIVFTRGWVDKLKDRGAAISGSSIPPAHACGSSRAAVGATRRRSGRPTDRGSRSCRTATAPCRFTCCLSPPANSRS